MAADEGVRAAGSAPSATAHEALAVVVQVRSGELSVLLWQRAMAPYSGAWALPGGPLRDDETLERSIRRHLAVKVDVRELAHLEQLETHSEPGRHPDRRVLATAYLGVVPADVEPVVPADTGWHPVRRLPATAFDHGAIVRAGVVRLQGKLSYTNVAFALAPATFTIATLRTVYRAALGYDVSATNLQRVLLRRGMLEPTGAAEASGPAGGRPATVFRFRTRTLEVTDPFAVLRPPRDK
ncbi:MAG: NUDIX domain-containing protein [Actinomycetota bacterium]|nr:NUDIX domain-containing protein [Actinomycetota bacterium]